MELDRILAGITPEDTDAGQRAKDLLDGLAKPLGSLGLLEDALIGIAALTGSSDISLKNRSLLIFCSDNRVTAKGVSQSGPEVTLAVAAALGKGESTACFMAKAARCRIIPVDVGILDAPALPGVLSRRIRNAAGDISEGPAMTRQECLRAIMTGFDLVRERKEAGDDILLLGEMGIGNTTSSCAAASVLLGCSPAHLAGRGAGLSDEGLKTKIRVIEEAIRVNRPDPEDPVEILAKVGGPDLAALCGALLGGAYYRIPVLLDGMITCTAALCAERLSPLSKKAMIASHRSAEPAAGRILEQLGLSPLITAGLRLGEGTGALLALPLLDEALAVYRSGHTFDILGIEPYVPQQ